MLAVYQKEFLHTALRVNALKFGEFTLKSGRVSPYFFNAGAFCDGEALFSIARAYAEKVVSLRRQGHDIDVLYGPAYKGIPLVAATATVLAAEYDWSLPWAFNRKEVKKHGEGGLTVGASLTGKRVLLIDDVLTAGTAIRESLTLLSHNDAQAIAVVVALDRQEQLEGGRSALQQIAQEYDLICDAIVGLDDLLSYVSNDEQLKAHLTSLKQYRLHYGARS